jgi:hypothetical protein
MEFAARNRTFTEVFPPFIALALSWQFSIHQCVEVRVAWPMAH